MKQQISPEQWRELSLRKRRVWVEYAKKRSYKPHLTQPSVGQMIELLDKHTEKPISVYTRSGNRLKWVVVTEVERAESGVLCDALWEITKIILEK